MPYVQYIVCAQNQPGGQWPMPMVDRWEGKREEKRKRLLRKGEKKTPNCTKFVNVFFKGHTLRPFLNKHIKITIGSSAALPRKATAEKKAKGSGIKESPSGTHTHTRAQPPSFSVQGDSTFLFSLFKDNSQQSSSQTRTQIPFQIRTLKTFEEPFLIPRKRKSFGRRK